MIRIPLHSGGWHGVAVAGIAYALLGLYLWSLLHTCFVAIVHLTMLKSVLTGSSQFYISFGHPMHRSLLVILVIFGEQASRGPAAVRQLGKELSQTPFVTHAGVLAAEAAALAACGQLEEAAEKLGDALMLHELLDSFSSSLDREEPREQQNRAEHRQLLQSHAKNGRSLVVAATALMHAHWKEGSAEAARAVVCQVMEVTHYLTYSFLLKHSTTYCSHQVHICCWH